MQNIDLPIQLHHVGCLVRSIAETIPSFVPPNVTSPAPKPIRIASQKVHVCFLETGSSTLIELVEPDSDNMSLVRMLDRGISFYHVGYTCKDIQEVEQQYMAAGARAVGRFASEAFEGRECVFLLTANGQMVELIQAPTRSGVPREPSLQP